MEDFVGSLAAPVALNGIAGGVRKEAAICGAFVRLNVLEVAPWSWVRMGPEVSALGRLPCFGKHAGLAAANCRHVRLGCHDHNAARRPCAPAGAVHLARSPPPRRWPPRSRAHNPASSCRADGFLGRRPLQAAPIGRWGGRWAATSVLGPLGLQSWGGVSEGGAVEAHSCFLSQAEQYLVRHGSNQGVSRRVLVAAAGIG